MSLRIHMKGQSSIDEPCLASACGEFEPGFSRRTPFDCIPADEGLQQPIHDAAIPLLCHDVRTAHLACPESRRVLSGGNSRSTSDASLVIVSQSSQTDSLKAHYRVTASTDASSNGSMYHVQPQELTIDTHVTAQRLSSQPDPGNDISKEKTTAQEYMHMTPLIASECSSDEVSLSTTCISQGQNEDRSSQVKQAPAMLLPPKFPGCPATIACFGDKTGCTYIRGARPTVKFGGIANRAIKAAFWNAGFQETSGSNWNVLWGSFMHRTALRTLKMHQICNHWPGTWELGRKDLFYQCATFQTSVCLDLHAWVMNTEWEAFHQHVKRSPGSVWIRKPLASSRGRGVRVVPKPAAITQKCKKAILQQYVHKPLCINGYKFDLRIYLAVTSFHPLRAYVYKNGLVRFASVKYDRSKASMSNRQMHLTNHAINRKYCNNAAHPIKWPIHDLWEHLKLQGKEDCCELIWRQVEELCALALLASHSRMTSQVMCYTGGRHSCFEIFGVDLILTESFVAKLLEVNTCPALSCTSDADKLVKFPMLAELLHIVGIQPELKSKHKIVSMGKQQMRCKQADKGPLRSGEQSAGEHARKWRNAPLQHVPDADLPKEIEQSEAEWSRMTSWTPCLPPVHASDQLREIYANMHWTHKMLMRWITCRSQNFPSRKAKPFATEPVRCKSTGHV